MCESIGEIRDQSDCGSCWAFGATEVGSDRICIATKGAYKPHLSAETLVACCDDCGMGCSGGQPSAAFDYFVSTGAPSGGNYGDKRDKSGCQMYSLPWCDHHLQPGQKGIYSPCGASEFPTPSADSTSKVLMMIEIGTNSVVVCCWKLCFSNSN